MAFSVYVLHSTSTGKIYIGQTDDLPKRIRQHNDPTYRVTPFTKRNRGPWVLVHSEEFPTRAAAMNRERALKSGQGRAWIKSLLSADEENKSSAVPQAADSQREKH